MGQLFDLFNFLVGVHGHHIRTRRLEGLFQFGGELFRFPKSEASGGLRLVRAFHFVFHAAGQLLDLFGFLDHIEREDVFV